MEYFSRLSRIVKTPATKQFDKPSNDDRVSDFHRSWTSIKKTVDLERERQQQQHHNQQPRSVKSTDLQKQLHILLDALVFESARTDSNSSAPPVLEYLLKNDLLSQLVKLAEPDIPRGFKGEVIKLYSSLLVLCDETFVVHSAVHRPLAQLLRSCIAPNNEASFGGGWITPDSEYEEDLTDLMCHVCSRIKSHPELLAIFFHEQHHYHSSPDPQSPTKSEQEFLIFSYLLKFIHREGRVGDFARAGLLFLVDVAASSLSKSTLSPHSPPTSPLSVASSTSTSTTASNLMTTDSSIDTLGNFLLESDFADVVGAGLCALYGVLPSKLVIRPNYYSDPSNENSDDTTGMVLGGMGDLAEDGIPRLPSREEEEEIKSRLAKLGVGVSSSEEFKKALYLFCRLVEFTQDVVRKATSSTSWAIQQQQQQQQQQATTANDDPLSNVAPTPNDKYQFVNTLSINILSSIRSIFLENVLYPSILECSESDGSAVAVMTYIESILTALDSDSNLAHTIIKFLLSEEEDQQKQYHNNDQGHYHDMEQEQPHQQEKDSNSLHTNDHEPIRSIKKRKSQALILMENASTSRVNNLSSYSTNNNSDRFSLKDLLIQHVDSKHPSTATAALNLLTTMLSQNGYDSISLLDIVPDSTATCFPTAPYPYPFNNSHNFNNDHKTISPNLAEDASFVYPGIIKTTTKKNTINNNTIGSRGDEEEDEDEDEDEDEVFIYPSNGHDSTILAETKQPKARSQTPTRLKSKNHDNQPSFSQLLSGNAAEMYELLSVFKVTSPSSSPKHARNASVFTAPSPLDIMGTGFSQYLDDAERRLARDPEFQRGLSPTSKQIPKHRLNVKSSPLLSSIVESLAHFFCHSPEHNLALTGVIAALATCPRRSLDGWLLAKRYQGQQLQDQKVDTQGDFATTSTPQQKQNPVDLGLFTSPAESDDGDDRSVDYDQDKEYQQGRQQQTERDSSCGLIFCIIRDLAVKINNYKKEVANFDTYLAERRQGLMFADNLADALDMDEDTFIETNDQVNQQEQQVNEKDPSNSGLSSLDLNLSQSDNAIPSTRSFSAILTGSKSKPSNDSPDITPPSTPTVKSDGYSISSRGHSRAKSTASLAGNHFNNYGNNHNNNGTLGSLSPFAAHYRKTASINVIPQISDVHVSQVLDDSFDGGSHTGLLGVETSSSASSFTASPRPDSQFNKDINSNPPLVSLSTVLDNIVILEETVKELVAIIQVRKSLGIDPF